MISCHQKLFGIFDRFFIRRIAGLRLHAPFSSAALHAFHHQVHRIDQILNLQRHGETYDAVAVAFADQILRCHQKHLEALRQILMQFCIYHIRQLITADHDSVIQSVRLADRLGTRSTDTRDLEAAADQDTFDSLGFFQLRQHDNNVRHSPTSFLLCFYSFITKERILSILIQILLNLPFGYLGAVLMPFLALGIDVFSGNMLA